LGMVWIYSDALSCANRCQGPLAEASTRVYQNNQMAR
jgi:hypothetical protein